VRKDSGGGGNERRSCRSATAAAAAASAAGAAGCVYMRWQQQQQETRPLSCNCSSNSSGSGRAHICEVGVAAAGVVGCVYRSRNKGRGTEQGVGEHKWGLGSAKEGHPTQPSIPNHPARCMPYQLTCTLAFVGSFGV